jgi:prophage antirepressor-like protein
MSITKHSTDLIALSFEGQGLRTFMDEHGMIWWVARDVCRILDLDNPSRALARLDADEKSTVLIRDLTLDRLDADENIKLTGSDFNPVARGNPRIQIVNEPGLYTLVLSSRKPEAKAFKRWLVHDVIPTLRRTGRYILSEPGQASGLSRSWEDFRQITPTQVCIFTWAWERPGRWFTTRELRQQTQIHEVTAREYARYWSYVGVWEKLHRHPANLYQVDQQAARQQCPVLVTHLLAARDLPREAFPVLPTPAWQ